MMNSLKQGRLLRWLFLAFVLFGTSVAVQPAAALSRDGVATALRSTVQVIVPDNDFEIFSLGSGTAINANGLILTNHHVVEGDSRNGYMNSDALAFIAVPPADLRGEAVIKYFGSIVKVDSRLDLALVQIIGLVDDPNAPLPSNLGLPAIGMGDSDDLMIGDEINMFGYPGLGGNTPTYTKGTVAGFLDEDRDGIYEWIKTDAELNHGNSGGLSTDDQGRFVGVPTMGNTDEIGKIGLVRSGNIALDFVNSYFPNPEGNSARVTNVRYAELINRRGDAINPATQFPSGITDIYAVFDYSGFADGGDFTYVWYSEGKEVERDSFAWDGGPSGANWVSTYDDNGLPDGFTELEIIYNGTPVYRGGVLIGEGTPIEQPVNPGVASFSDITFAANVDSNNRPIDINNSFVGIYDVYAFFEYTGMVNGVDWVSRWYYQNQMVLETPATWDSGASGSTWVSLHHPDGLPAGRYELELEVQGEVFKTGIFTVQEGSQPQKEVGVTGIVIDQDNRRTTISGAFIVFLQPGISIDQWIGEDFPDSMIHGVANSNRNGEWQLDNTVIPGEYYSVVVLHDDYKAVAVDDWQIPPDTADPYELEVSMERS